MNKREDQKEFQSEDTSLLIYARFIILDSHLVPLSFNHNIRPFSTLNLPVPLPVFNHLTHSVYHYQDIPLFLPCRVKGVTHDSSVTQTYQKDPAAYDHELVTGSGDLESKAEVPTATF